MMTFIKFVGISLGLIFITFLIDSVVNLLNDRNRLKKWWRKHIIGTQ